MCINLDGSQKDGVTFLICFRKRGVPRKVVSLRKGGGFQLWKKLCTKPTNISEITHITLTHATDITHITGITHITEIDITKGIQTYSHSDRVVECCSHMTHVIYVDMLCVNMVHVLFSLTWYLSV